MPKRSSKRARLKRTDEEKKNLILLVLQKDSVDIQNIYDQTQFNNVDITYNKNLSTLIEKIIDVYDDAKYYNSTIKNAATTIMFHRTIPAHKENGLNEKIIKKFVIL